MNLVEVREDFKLEPHTRHTIVLRGRNPQILVGNFDFFFGHLFVRIFCVRALDVLGYQKASAFDGYCSLAVTGTLSYPFSVALVERPDATEPGTCRATTRQGCTEVYTL